jgi:hypothetical protein
MTEKKLTPDELACAVKDMIEANGDCLTGLSFDTRDGGHDYRTITAPDMATGVAKAFFDR